MRFTLKDYQTDAVVDVLRNLRKARRNWQEDGDASSFSLTATTGSGKTVMAAAVIEALFHGNDDYDFAADPGAVVLWFTDDPSLNEQTRRRLWEASDLEHGRTKVIDTAFQADALAPGHVYFLNTQKLGKNSLLVRGAPDSAPTGNNELFPLSHKAPPDLRAQTMWDILRNTIEDKNLTLYLILDEAHRGMKAPTAPQRNERATIVQRLVNGTGGGGFKPIPIVWGISATVQRFDDAMANAEARVNFPNVVVDPARVQESGLLKDDIRLEFPAEPGQFDTVLLARATRRVAEATRLWAEYAQAQNPPIEPVVPLLVVQMPNTPSNELLQSAFDTVRDAWPELKAESLAHVFGDHRTLEIGPHVVPHISPEKVQDSDWIRVLFAKDAISTGWDCPRAEVLMSFRPAQDETHITQLLGRMVRTPLARRIPGDDRLNSVECVLPHFNRATATAVGDLLLGRKGVDAGGSGGGGGRRVLTDPVDMLPNPAISDAVWSALDTLPSQTLPRKAARPMKRLMALAHALSYDGLVANASKAAYSEMCDVLAGLMARHKKLVEKDVASILAVEGETVIIGVHEPKSEYQSIAFTEQADERSVDGDFKTSWRVFSQGLAKQFAERLEADAGDDDDGLFEAYIRVAALSRVEGLADELDREADKLTRRWLDQHRVAIKGLGDERRAAYDDIIAMSTDPQRIGILRPRVRAEETKDGDGKLLAVVPSHLMCDGDGKFPVAVLNLWERKVLDAEMGRSDFLAWYRNPGRASEDSLAVAYKDGNDGWRRMCPDFIFFHGKDSGVRVSIADPHSYHLGDALPKLKGLAAFAETFGDEFHRIEALSELDNVLRVLDLQEKKVRNAVREATDAQALYRSTAAANY